MCQYDICGCAPVESGRQGPRVSTVVDRRVRPLVRIAGDRRGRGPASGEGRVIVLDPPVPVVDGGAAQRRREPVAGAV